MTHRTVREVRTADVMSGARSAAHTTREAATGRVRPGGGTILDAIGNTPLVLVDGIWVKLEYLNPSVISSPDLGVLAVAAAGVLCAFPCVADALPEQCLRRKPGADLLVAAAFRTN